MRLLQDMEPPVKLVEDSWLDAGCYRWRSTLLGDCTVSCCMPSREPALPSANPSMAPSSAAHGWLAYCTVHDGNTITLRSPEAAQSPC